MIRNYENLHFGIFETEGKFGIPKILPTVIKQIPDMIGFNYAKTQKNKLHKGVHFFLDDYQFERLWNRPFDYIAMLQKFRVVFSPDFSLYTDFPKAIQIYNHYRKHYLARLWQSEGITVVPTICWSDESSFEWCFDGEPRCSAVALSSVGTQMSKVTKDKFLIGYKEMMKRLEPETVFFYGNVPAECRGNIIRVKAFQDKFIDTK